MEQKCPYCKGSGFIGTGYTEKEVSGHRVMYPYTEPCYCNINFCIGKKFGMLSPVMDAHPADSAYVHKTYSTMDSSDQGNRGYLFYGSESLFLYLVKSYFLNGFMSRNYIILEGGTIVEQYNVPKDSSGEWLTTAHLNQYDMLALLFTTSARYTSIKDCVLEVIKNRGRLMKLTWIYARSEDHIKDAREYSPELENYFKSYKRVDLGTVPKLKGYSSNKAIVAGSGKKMNDALAKI